ncbi:MAG: hypothetical protein LBJ65_08570 [Burkholderia sp.]|nr:hypothetical protein [Burkholderia sp.]
MPESIRRSFPICFVMGRLLSRKGSNGRRVPRDVEFEDGIAARRCEMADLPAVRVDNRAQDGQAESGFDEAPRTCVLDPDDGARSAVFDEELQPGRRGMAPHVVKQRENGLPDTRAVAGHDGRVGRHVDDEPGFTKYFAYRIDGASDFTVERRRAQVECQCRRLFGNLEVVNEPEQVERGCQQAHEQHRREHQVSGCMADHRVGRCVMRQRNGVTQRVQEERSGAGGQHGDDCAQADRLPDLPAGSCR